MTRLEQLEKQANDILEEIKNMKQEDIRKRRGIPVVGETVTVADMEWIILDKVDSGYFAITKEVLMQDDVVFDEEANDWKISTLRTKLWNDIGKKIEADIGKGKIVSMHRDLTSDDGLKDYGSCTDHVSMLTADEYRKYREYLPNTGEWWWLITAHSTSKNDCHYSTKVVSPLGFVDLSLCDSNFNGVRPCCIFPSSIFQSCDDVNMKNIF